jgi:hypothetical protein
MEWCQQDQPARAAGGALWRPLFVILVRGERWSSGDRNDDEAAAAAAV